MSLQRAVISLYSVNWLECVLHSKIWIF